MIYVITGGAGFIGLNLVAQMISRGVAEIRIVDNFSNSSAERIEAVLHEVGAVECLGRSPLEWKVYAAAGDCTVTVHAADIRVAETALLATRDAHAVINLAAQTGIAPSLKSPRGDLEVNVMGTFNFLEACRANSVAYFFTASSAAVLGNSPPPQHEDGTFRPLSPYGASKATTEAYCSAFYQSFGVRTLALRFSNVYGKRSWSKGSVVALFCKNLIEGKPLTINGDGMQTRDFLHVDDLASVIVQLAAGDTPLSTEEDIFGRALNVATGVQTPIVDLAETIRTIARSFGKECEILFGSPLRGDVRISAPDITRVRAVLPQAHFRDLRAGLPETLSWFLENWPTRV